MFEAQHGFDACQQFSPVDRLGQEFVGPAFQAPHLVFGAVEGRDHDDRNAGRCGITFDFPGDLVPVHDGHHDIQQDQVGVFRTCESEGFFPTVSRDDGIVVLAENGTDQFDVHGVVIHHQNLALARPGDGGGRFCSRWCGCLFNRRQSLTDAGQEGAGVDGFGDVVVAAGGQGVFPVAIHGQTREGDHRDIRQLRRLFETPGSAQAIQAGELDIHEDEVRMMPGSQFQTGFRLAGFQDLVVAEGQDAAHQLHVQVIVFDHQNGMGHVNLLLAAG